MSLDQNALQMKCQAILVDESFRTQCFQIIQLALIPFFVMCQVGIVKFPGAWSLQEPLFYQTCSTKHVLPNMFYQTVEFPEYIMYVLLSTLMCVYLVHLLLVPSSRGLEELLCDSNSLEELLWRRSASGERLRRHNLRSHIVAVCILV